MSYLFTNIKQLSDVGAMIGKASRTLPPTMLRRKQTILSVSLFNGRFKALSIINNTIHQGWVKPDPVLSTPMLRQAFQEAIHHTQFPGTHVAMLVDDPRFISRTLQFPPMHITDLRSILERKVKQENLWVGGAAWRYRMGLESRGKLSIYLEIWPQRFVDDIVQICQEAGLFLRQLGPLSILTESQLGVLPVDQGKASLLVSMLEGKIMFIAGKDDGTPLWIRHLIPTGNALPLGERVGTEVNRTVMFITQQTNLSIPQIWLLSEEECVTVEDIQPHLSIPITPFPIKPDWKYWLWVGATLPVDHSSNFTPEQVLQAPLRRALTKTIAAMLAIFLILGVGSTSAIEGYLSKNHSAVRQVTDQVTALHQDRERWKSRLMSLQTQREWIDAVKTASRQDVEGPFLSYLGTILPTHIILQRVYLERTEEGWKLELDGSSTSTLPDTLLEIARFDRELADGPYHVSIHKDWRDQLLAQPATSASSSQRLSAYRFTMKGTMS